MLAAALPTTQVTWAGHAIDFARESAWMGQANFTEEAVAGFRSGALPHNEAYAVPVVFMATTEGNDPRATEERAYAMAALFEDALRQSGSTSVSNVHWAYVVDKAAELTSRDNGWVAFVDLIVGVQASI